MIRDLEVRHCRVLLALHESGGVAAAARALDLAQSTVSETLLSLERVVGMPVVLRRRGREAALTPAAEALLPHARALVSASETALEVFASQSHGIIRLGAVESISSFLLPRPLRAFRQRWPRVDVRITIGLCEDLRRRVGRFELDAALSIESEAPAAAEEGDRRRTLAPAQLILVVSPQSPLAAAPVGRAELAGRNFLLADPDGAFNRLMRQWFGSDAAASFQSAGSIEGVKRGVRSGDGIGVLPFYAVAEELQSGALSALDVRETLPGIALQLTTHERPSPTSPLHNLIEEVGASFRDI